MNRLAALWARMKEQTSRARIDREFREELQEHAAALRDEHMRRGLSADDAHRAAMLDIGGFEQARELVNERRGFVVLDHLARDIRHALRVLRKSPGFATVSVLTLALGIGANAAIFSFIDAVMLRPLPYPQSERLVAIWEEGESGDRMSVAPANVADYARVSGFDEVAMYTNAPRSVTGNGLPEAHIVETVSWNYFRMLRTPPAIGRAFLPEEDAPSARKVAIISDALWKSRFGGDPGILSRAISLDSVPHDIVGVMPPGFRGLTQYGVADPRHIWLPIAWPAEVLNNRGEHMGRLAGRLRDGAQVAAAREELARVSESLAATYPTNKTVRASTMLLTDDVVKRVKRSLVALMLTVGLILAIACVNVANLLIARGVGRRREVAVRYALGATRGRVYTALITESVVLAVLASIAGLCLAIWIKGLLVGSAPVSTPRLDDVAIGWRAVGFTLVLSLVTGIVFGGLPAWQAGSANPIDAMSSGARVVAGRHVMRWRSALMAAQLALSVLLLVGAGLMIKSLWKLNSVELGFDTAGVVTLRTTLPAAKYPTPEARLAFFTAVRERLTALPGVAAVGFANAFPLRGAWSSGFQIDGVPAPAKGYHGADFQAVSPDYFKALGIPLLKGRAITESDTNSGMPVAVVSEAFERKLLNGENAIGKRINRGGPLGAPITIVGVVRDVRRDGRTYEIESQVYLPAAQTKIYPVRLSEIAVRAAKGDGLDLVPAIRSAVWAVDANQPITNLRSLDDILLSTSAERRFQTLLFTIFAALALVLASIGTYGVIAYLVSQRTPEIGVRMALGASRGRIYQWLLGRTFVLVVAGTLAGLVLSRYSAKSIEALLFEVTPGDVSTYALAAGVLMFVSLAACALAVRRAARINPTSALRYE